MKNNILIITYDFYPNNMWGTGINTYHLSNYLSIDNNVVVVTYNTRCYNYKYKVISPGRICTEKFLTGKYIENNSYKDSDLLQAFNVLYSKKVIKKLKEINFKPDIILNQGWMSWALSKNIANQYNSPIITEVHFFEKQYLLTNNKSSKTDWKDIFKIEKDMFKNSKLLISFSDTETSQLKEMYRIQPEKIITVYHSIELPDKKRKKTDDTVKLLFVGRLVEDKGILELIESFQKVKRLRKNVSLIVVGDGVLYNDIQQKYGKIITLTGWLEAEDIYNYYNSCDIFCFPSKSETFGVVLIEAMKYKIPIVTTFGKTVSNIIRNNENGLTIDLKYTENNVIIDTHELTEKIIEIIDNKELRYKLSQNAYKEYVEKYKDSEFISISRIVSEVINHKKG